MDWLCKYRRQMWLRMDKTAIETGNVLQKTATAAIDKEDYNCCNLRCALAKFGREFW